MFDLKDNIIKISVRNLVEFILKSGDLDNRRVVGRDAEAMREGSKLHRKIQKRMGSNYSAEVPLSITVPLILGEEEISLVIEGRADGIINNENGNEIRNNTSINSIRDKTEISSTGEKEQLSLSDVFKDTWKHELSNHDSEISPIDRLEISMNVEESTKNIIVEDQAENESELEPAVIIDEIKGMYLDVKYLEEPFYVHKAQVMCYAYIYAKKYEYDRMGIRLTYCNIETEVTKYFHEVYTFTQLKHWFLALVDEYKKWADWQYHWRVRRNSSIKQIEFPFTYRPSQKELVTGVYKSIIRDKKLFIQAPTGVGKTISTLFPTVKAMGEEKTTKIFYLTAKTITRTVAEETFRILSKQGLAIKVVTITAKDKICVLDKPECNPDACVRAKGHYDRVNDAVFDLLTNENEISRELIEQYATKHLVCPFEMGLDVTTWADGVICDYNYVFDPNVYLRRFFADEKKNDYVFLIDEAHNLVDRAREMFSASLYKDHFLKVKKIVAPLSKKLEKRFEVCNQDLLKLKRECDECRIIQNITDFILHLMRLIAEYEEFMQEYPNFEGKEDALLIYFDIRQFIYIYELMDDKYVVYTDHDEKEGFLVKLLCMDPSKNLLTNLDKGRSAIFFSATLLPIHYYKEQLGGNEEDYAIYAPSPFDTKNRLLVVGNDVSTKYTRRNQTEYEKILDYIKKFIEAKVGNYLVFFPSYIMMNSIYELVDQREMDADFILQHTNMTEMEREEFLNEFEIETKRTKVGFCVMGGVFSEGIDLTKDRLIGAVIVGTGLPMISNERELYRGYYDEVRHAGFDYAYLYVGMNKVLQSAGRVIRTNEDRGTILLLDERFTNSQYKNLFPREWFPHSIVNRNSLETKLKEFWDGVRLDNEMI